MPWVGIDDAIGALHRAVFDPSLAGAVNVVAPNPVQNRDFARCLGRVMRRPWFAPAPAFALAAILGRDKARELLFYGQRLRPARLERCGFRFLHPELEPALRHLLGKQSDFGRPAGTP
jgi:NAD dependent epimerase/dehydratase family enzyme